jgi:hypothetical protein
VSSRALTNIENRRLAENVLLVVPRVSLDFHDLALICQSTRGRVRVLEWVPK